MRRVVFCAESLHRARLLVEKPLMRAFVAFNLCMVLLIRSAAAETIQIVVDGRVRTLQLELAANAGPRPTIIMLHGSGGPATVDQHIPGLAQVASRAGFVTARPEGVGGKWNIFPPGKISDGDKRRCRRASHGTQGQHS